MIGIDADYGMSRAYQAPGWPTFVVVDATGVIRFHGFDSDRNLAGVRRCLRDILKATPEDPEQVLENGVAYPAGVLAGRKSVRDRSPRLAFDRAGSPVVVYYSNREGTNAVYLRRFRPNAEALPPERVSPPGVESYAADCVYDSAGTLWVAWCGLGARFYDIQVQSRREGAPPATEQLTFSDDDAMSPKIAAGPDGKVAVTYYKWAKMNGISRDRNIFARTYEPSRRAWSTEVEVSPHEPVVEDHTDPDVVIDREGQVWVAWSYDYHPQLFKRPVEAGQPTIFAASVGAGSASAPLLVGATGEYKWAIDLFPSAAVDKAGTLWCVWDCSEPQRCLRLARLDPATKTFTGAGVFGEGGGVSSTPELASAADGLLLAWSQREAAGRWQGKVALIKQGKRAAETTIGEKEDVLFPQAQQAPDGGYWVVYEKADAKGSTVVLRSLSRELGHPEISKGAVTGTVKE